MSEETIGPICRPLHAKTASTMEASRQETLISQTPTMRFDRPERSNRSDTASMQREGEGRPQGAAGTAFWRTKSALRRGGECRRRPRPATRLMCCLSRVHLDHASGRAGMIPIRTFHACRCPTTSHRFGRGAGRIAPVDAGIVTSLPETGYAEGPTKQCSAPGPDSRLPSDPVISRSLIGHAFLSHDAKPIGDMHAPVAKPTSSGLERDAG